MVDLAPVSVTFVADGNDLTPIGFRLDERLNRPYELRVRITSEDLEFEPGSLLGKNATLTLTRDDTLARDVHGVVTRVEEGARPDELTQVFDLTVVPALMALELSKNSAIYQEISVVDVLQDLFDSRLQPWGRGVDIAEGGSSDPVEYLVRYQETCLAFCERLMEEYGIGYRFDHSGDIEKLELFFDESAFVDLESHGNTGSNLPVTRRDDLDDLATEAVRDFRLVSSLRPTTATTRVFSWTSPSAPSTADDDSPTDFEDFSRPVDGAAVSPAREMYEHEAPTSQFGYRSEFDFALAEQQTSLRRELHRRDALLGRGESSAIGLAPGILFELSGNPEADLDYEYYATHVVHEWGALVEQRENHGGGKGKGKGKGSYRNYFDALPSGVVWRPERRRPKPRIFGLQTAVVVGPDGEEIHTDEHGRIKCKFPWCREEQMDDSVSCFIRVLQSWAGQNWGAVFLPRIGMEVAVTFIDGDPDRPVVTGCLYNHTNPPPYTLPDDKTKSTIMSSTHGGEGFNEFRFEDAAGSEEVYIHAQKDFNEDVLNDHNTNVGNNQTNTVGVDQTEDIGQHQTLTVGGNRSITVSGNFDETIEGTENRSVTGDVSETFSGSETRNVAVDHQETIGGNATRTIAGNRQDTVAGSSTETVAGSATETVIASHSITAIGGFTMTTPASTTISSLGGFTVTAPGGINLIDNAYWSIGSTAGTLCGQQSNFVGQQINGTLLKNDFNAVLTTVNATSFMASSVDLSAVAVAGQANRIDLAEDSVSFKTGAVCALTCGIVMLN